MYMPFEIRARVMEKVIDAEIIELSSSVSAIERNRKYRDLKRSIAISNACANECRQSKALLRRKGRSYARILTGVAIVADSESENKASYAGDALRT